MNFKLIFAFLILILISACSNIKTVEISDELKRIDEYNSRGEILNSYYKKFNKETNRWYSAKCESINTSNEICKYTAMALNEIRFIKIARKSAIKDQSNISQDQTEIQEQKTKNQDSKVANNILPLKNNNEECNGDPLSC